MIVLFFISSLIFLLSFLIGVIFIFQKKSSAKLRSGYSIFLAVCMLFYIISSLFLIAKGNFLYIIFALSPFIIGNISSYKKLGFYAAVQILVVLTGCLLSGHELFAFINT